MNTQDNNFMFPKKSELTSLDISLFNNELPDLKNIFDSKVSVISKWLTEKISKGLSNGTMKVDNILPSKAEFAYLLGVSIGTMQNAFRQIEDAGVVESKQCIGTLVRDINAPSAALRKLTSKRELAADAIKRYILSDGFREGASLPSTKTISTIIGFSVNTTRLALDYLASQDILLHKYKKSNENGWYIKHFDFDVENSSGTQGVETLVDMVVKDLENYITKNLKVGDKMPSHKELSIQLKASLKTVHDALKVLIDRGVLLARRGRYGTSVVRVPNAPVSSLKPETSIFAPAKDAAFIIMRKHKIILKR